MASTLRRFLVLQVLLVWQGGFLFYAAVVVPTGTRLLGAAGQGVITARVTDALNAIGAVGLAALAMDLRLTRDPHRHRVLRRWAAWAAALLCHGLLVYFHVRLDALMADPGRPEFYALHRLYLLASATQWAACVLLTWWTLRAWRDEDRTDTNHRDAETQRRQEQGLS
jgi:hypothetical protein